MSIADVIALISRLRDRISSGFGRIVLPPTVPLDGPRGIITHQPTLQERDDVEALLTTLQTTYEFVYGRDELELTYERGRLTLARISFAA